MGLQLLSVVVTDVWVLWYYVKGFSLRTGRAHLLSAHGAGPAHLLSAQEEEPAHLLSAQEEGPAHLLSAQEVGSAHLLSAQAAESAHLLSAQTSDWLSKDNRDYLIRKSGNVIPSLVVDYGQRAIVTTRTTWAMSLWHVNGFDVVQLVRE
ncbi:hypothetical protein L1987_78596 [Smallanthus sonchifolius]|uniref:Uncharacterized protein n=1 Tax=Smallanthus sonchifolius TaxID=185202 RepID=A0ACB8ZE52_9ASTR|nr:hypothetical protein L1987_78596 [Smallanthus sonchifolius]